MRKMRKIKLIAFLLSVTSCLFLLSTGFATWYNVNFPEGIEDKEGSFEAYDVLTIENNKIENKEMDMFNFSMFSFKTSTQTFENCDTGSITIQYKVPKETLAATGGTFKVDFSLGYDDLAVENHELFKTAINGTEYTVNKNKVKNSCVVSFDVDDTPVTPTITQIKEGETVVGDTLDCSKTFTVAAGSNGEYLDYTFNVTYNFTIYTKADNGTFIFKDVFGKYLRGADGTGDVTKFVASAHVTDITDTN